MKKRNLILPALAAALCCASCVDSDYDLNDINTESRFYVTGLTVPINMEPVKLDIMLDISDDSDIQKDEAGNYYFRKDGLFFSDPISVKKITLKKPEIEFDGKVAISMRLNEETKQKMLQYAGDKTMGQILSDPALMQLLGITAETEVVNLNLQTASTATDIKLNATGIDAHVRSIETLGLDATVLGIAVKVNGLEDALQPFAINALKIELPKGLIATAAPGTTYDPAKGLLTPVGGSFALDNDFVADLSLGLTGINYNQLQEPGTKVFDPERHTFTYSKSCSASGNALLRIKDLKSSAKVADILALEQEGAVTYECNIGFAHDLTVSEFKGEITYSMDDVLMDPVSVGNIPDLLRESGTNIDLMNPQIYLCVENNLSEYGIQLNTQLEVTGNNTITAPLAISQDESTDLVLAPTNESLFHSGFTFQPTPELRGIVGSNEGETFPELLFVRLIEPQVPCLALQKSFPLGVEVEGIGGTWEFYTRLSLTDKTRIKYTKEWDDWGSDDLDGLTINDAVVTATLQKDVALDAESLEFILEGNEGSLRGTTALVGDASQKIVINLKGGPVSEIQGATVNVRMKGTNKDLNKNQQIKIADLKVTVNGYYDREL